MAKTTTTHKVTLTLQFDRPCSRAHATQQARNCIHGEFYPDAIHDGDPEKMIVRRVETAKMEGKR